MANKIEKEHSNDRDPWVKDQRRSYKTIFKHGPAWQTEDDLELGQPGQVIRDAIRHRIIVNFFAKAEINLIQLRELLSD